MCVCVRGCVCVSLCVCVCVGRGGFARVRAHAWKSIAAKLLKDPNYLKIWSPDLKASVVAGEAQKAIWNERCLA